MTAPPIMELAALDRTALLDLNNANAVELSWLEPARLTQLLDWASYARGIGPAGALLIAFDQDAGYDGVHFHWFRARYPRFLYVDRIAVAATARGLGLARTLYADLFDFARRSRQTVIGCEINSVPPNPGSDRFHAGFGFRPIGTASMPGGKPGGKTVRYMARTLDDGTENLLQEQSQ